MEPVPVLELNHISKRYGDTPALSDISLSFLSGCIYGIVGQNGSGKSTLLHLIAGVVRPDEGEMRVFGRPYAPKEPADADKNGIFSVLEVSNLTGTLSVAENTLRDRYPKSPFGFIKWRALYRQAEELYRTLNIPMDVFAEVGTLPLQERRIVSLTRAYFASARILLLDEPDFSPEDPNAPAILHMLRSIAAGGGCILITTHRLNTLLDIVDHVVVLEHGELHVNASKNTLSAKELISIVSGKHMETPDIYPKLHLKQGPPLLRLFDVTTQDGVSHLSLDLHKGEILGIAALRTGLRTAIPRLLYGLDPLKSGYMTLLGQKISIKSPADAIRYGIGRLQEDRVETGLQIEFPIGPNISLGNLKAFRLLGLFQKRKEEHVARGYIRKLNIKTASLKEHVSKLSTGNQQKVLLSRLLFSNCRMLMLEEPTKNLDKSTTSEIYNFMSHFVQKGGTILLASSHVDELIGMCDRILILRDDGGYSIQKRVEFDKETILSFSL